MHEFQLAKSSDSDIEEYENHDIDDLLPNCEILHQADKQDEKKTTILVRKKCLRQQGEHTEKNNLTDNNHTHSNSVLKRLQTRPSRKTLVKSLWSEETNNRQKEFRPVQIINSEYILLNTENRLSQSKESAIDYQDSLESLFALDTNNNKNKEKENPKSREKKRSKSKKKKGKSKRDEKKDNKRHKSNSKKTRKKSKSVAIDATSAVDFGSKVKEDSGNVPMPSILKQPMGLSSGGQLPVKTMDTIIQPHDQTLCPQILSSNAGQQIERPIGHNMTDITTHTGRLSDRVNDQSATYLPGMSAVHNICEEVNKIISNMSSGYCTDPIANTTSKDSFRCYKTLPSLDTKEGDHRCISDLANSLRKTFVINEPSSSSISDENAPNQCCSNSKLNLTDPIWYRHRQRYEKEDIQNIVKDIQREIRKQSKSRSKSRKSKDRFCGNGIRNLRYLQEIHHDYSTSELEKDYDCRMRKITKKLENLQDIKNLISRKKVSSERKLNRCKKEVHCLCPYQSPGKCFRVETSFQDDVDSEKRRLEKALSTLNCHRDKHRRPNDVCCKVACYENQPIQHSICTKNIAECQNNHYKENYTRKNTKLCQSVDCRDNSLLTRAESKITINKKLHNNEFHQERVKSPVQVHVHFNDYQLKKHQDNSSLIMENYSGSKLVSVDSDIKLRNTEEVFYKNTLPSYDKTEVHRVHSRIQMKADHHRAGEGSSVSKTYHNRKIHNGSIDRNYEERSLSRKKRRKSPRLSIHIDKTTDKNYGKISRKDNYKISRFSQEESLENSIIDSPDVQKFKERNTIIYSPRTIENHRSLSLINSCDTKYDTKRKMSKIQSNRKKHPLRLNVLITDNSQKDSLSDNYINRSKTVKRWKRHKNKVLKFADSLNSHNFNHNSIHLDNLNSQSDQPSTLLIESNDKANLTDKSNKNDARNSIKPTFFHERSREHYQYKLEKTRENYDEKNNMIDLMKNDKRKSSNEMTRKKNSNYHLNFPEYLIELKKLDNQYSSANSQTDTDCNNIERSMTSSAIKTMPNNFNRLFQVKSIKKRSIYLLFVS